MLKFYLPNFEDLVDPNYDFIHDRPSATRGDRFHHDRYPHEFFEEPIYDGMLMSKTIVVPSVEKRIRKAGGVHSFMRMDHQVPVMGDCGAFTYRDSVEPPYATDEILDYYQTLGFTFGVCIDHVVFSGFPQEEQERRWRLTLRNADEFLKRHAQKGCTFVPVGIAQGPTTERYAEAIHELVNMGYQHLALGGLARSHDKEIRAVLHAVSCELPKGTELHMFGVARLSLVHDFIRYGVTSADSASPMRRAFLGMQEDNYWALDGNHYAAVRVPEATAKRRKRGVNSPDEVLQGDHAVNSHDDLQALEQKALAYLRAYARDETDLQKTLDAVLEYDRLYGDDRDHEAWYHRTLKDRPWLRCGCAICQDVGIEVVIFRGNNRNRRRGFHNVRVFHEQFRAKVAEVMQAMDGELDPEDVIRQLALDL